MTLLTIVLGCGLLSISLGFTTIKDRLDRIADILETFVDEDE